MLLFTPYSPGIAQTFQFREKGAANDFGIIGLGGKSRKPIRIAGTSPTPSQDVPCKARKKSIDDVMSLIRVVSPLPIKAMLKFYDTAVQNCINEFSVAFLGIEPGWDAIKLWS